MPSKKLLCLGDSYTIGEAVPQSQRWCNLLVERLAEKHAIYCELSVLAKTGWTTAELLTAIEDASLSGTFDWVTLMIGVNNQYRGQSTTIFATELSKLIEIAVQFAASQSQCVWLISIPDWGVTPFAAERDSQQIAAEIDSFNTVARDLAERFALNWIDVTELSRQSTDRPELIASDQLHPGEPMHQLWCDAIESALVNSPQP